MHFVELAPAYTETKTGEAYPHPNPVSHPNITLVFIWIHHQFSSTVIAEKVILPIVTLNATTATELREVKLRQVLLTKLWLHSSSPTTNPESTANVIQSENALADISTSN
jgi:hypothetical protein